MTTFLNAGNNSVVVGCSLYCCIGKSVGFLSSGEIFESMSTTMAPPFRFIPKLIVGLLFIASPRRGASVLSHEICAQPLHTFNSFFNIRP